jgi:hypothetical protein
VNNAPPTSPPPPPYSPPQSYRRRQWVESSDGPDYAGNPFAASRAEDLDEAALPPRYEMRVRRGQLLRLAAAISADELDSRV